MLNMKITRKNLDDAVEDNILSSEQAGSLVEYLKNQPNSGPGIDFTHSRVS